MVLKKKSENIYTIAVQSWGHFWNIFPFFIWYPSVKCNTVNVQLSYGEEKN